MEYAQQQVVWIITTIWGGVVRYLILINMH